MKFSAIAAAAIAGVATLSGAHAQFVPNSEGRILIQVVRPEQDAQTVADLVGDIFQDKPMIAWARPQELEQLIDLGIELRVVENDIDETVRVMQETGGMPLDLDGNIVSAKPEDVTSYFPEQRVWKDGLDTTEKSVGQALAYYDDDSWYLRFHPLPELLAKSKQYAFHASRRLNSKWIDNIGNSFENREIPLWEFGGRNNEEKDQKWVFYVTGVHAREWITPHSMLFATKEMLRKYEEGDERVINILDNVRVAYLPMGNPDGYVYSWTVDRFWRKNRNPVGQNPGGFNGVDPLGVRIVCPAGSNGIDLNRNYEDHFGGAGTSSNPCSDLYCGPNPFSEPEVRGIVDYQLEKKNLGGDWLQAVDFHAYSALIMRYAGWGNIPNEVCPNNQAAMVRLGALQQQAILDVSGVYYENVNIEGGLYAAASSGVDWWYANLTEGRGGMAYELRPTRNSLEANTLLLPFAPPPTEIIPTGEEMTEPLIIIIEDASKAARGLEPRIVYDTDYLDVYGDEGYYSGDERSPVSYCEEPTSKTTRAQQADDNNDDNADAQSSASAVSTAGAVAVAALSALAALFH